MFLRSSLVSVVLLFLAVAGFAEETKQRPFGLEKRTPWTTSQVKGSPEPPLPFRPARVFPDVLFNHPVTVTNAPGTPRLFIAEQAGKIYSVDPTAAKPQAELFFDVQTVLKQLIAAEKEELNFEGLYGLTFHPQFAENREFFLCYVVNYKQSSKGQHPRGSRVVRMKADRNTPPQADPQSEQEVLTFLQGGHNGGCLKFGPDGCLYISTGDGGFAYPPDGRKTGQDVTDLLSSVLRIDVDHPQGKRPYTIPADNPFVNLPQARGEVWAYGFRNPWKMSFDRKTGELWVGDVGWELWEMIFRTRKGNNFGWSVMEGQQPVNTEWERGPTPIRLPTIEIPHTDGASITGGFVYRGKQFPELVGMYIFGDWETRRIWGTNVDREPLAPYVDLAEPTVRIIDFAEDNEGELYLLDYDDGTLLQLVRNTPTADRPKFPTTLRETGLLRDVRQHLPADGVIPFSINAEQWHDFATAERLLAVPDDGVIKLYSRRIPVPGSMFDRQLEFPLNTVLMKTLSLEMQPGEPKSRQRIETQLLHYTGRDWQAYTYAWNAEQTDATLVPREGAERTLTISDPQAPGGKREERWRYFSRAECLRCHNPWADYALAFQVPQLNREHPFGTVRDNQIRTYRHIGLWQDVLLPNDPGNPHAKAEMPRSETELPRLANPYETEHDLDARARAYLQVNCAHCHRSGGGGSAYLHLNHELRLRELKAVGVRPAQGTFGIPEANVLAAGDPYRSTLFLRLMKTGPGHMPALGSRLVDRRGTAVIHDWIRQLPVRLEDQDRIDRLAALDESAALAREAETAPREKFNLARAIARDAKRAEPSAEDHATADVRYRQDATARAAKRVIERESLVQEVLSTPSRALLTARGIEQGKFTDALRELLLSFARTQGEATVRDVLEPFLPAHLRLKRLGEVIDPAQILAAKGDASRGQAWFATATTSQCRNCHKIGDVGKELGPDLSQIGKRMERGKILENILQPAKEIAPPYVTWLVETTQGEVLHGLLVKRDDTQIVLKDAQLKEHRFKPADIERIVPQQKSLMPELLLNELTLEQVADLLAFLESRK